MEAQEKMNEAASEEIDGNKDVAAVQAKEAVQLAKQAKSEAERAEQAAEAAKDTSAQEADKKLEEKVFCAVVPRLSIWCR